MSYYYKAGAIRPGFSLKANLKKQYRNESILKPVVLEPLLSVPHLPRQFNPPSGYKIPDIKFPEDKMVLQAYRAAKAANPALSYTAFNIIVDRQISLMEEGYKPEFAAKVATAEQLLQRRQALLERQFFDVEAKEFTQDLVEKKEVQIYQNVMKESATQIRMLLNKVLMEVRNEGALYRLSLEDIRAHTKNPQIEAADVEEVADTIDGAMELLDPALLQAARLFEPLRMKLMNRLSVTLPKTGRDEEDEGLGGEEKDELTALIEEDEGRIVSEVSEQLAEEEGEEGMGLEEGNDKAERAGAGAAKGAKPGAKGQAKGQAKVKGAQQSKSGGKGDNKTK
jgi:hypothetical protein